MVTDNQKNDKYNHVIIKIEELISYQLSYQWTENSALWSAFAVPIVDPYTYLCYSLIL